MADGDVTKLPKWAQDRIHYLERELAAARAENKARFENQPTRIAWIDYSNIQSGDCERYLPEHGPFRFYFGAPGSHHDIDSVDVHLLKRNGHLVLEVSARGLTIHPQASNMIWITPKEKENGNG